MAELQSCFVVEVDMKFVGFIRLQLKAEVDQITEVVMTADRALKDQIRIQLWDGQIGGLPEIEHMSAAQWSPMMRSRT
jgi:hypothetical protein